MISPLPIDRLNDLRKSSSPEGSVLPSKSSSGLPRSVNDLSFRISSRLERALGSDDDQQSELRRYFIAQQVQVDDLAADLVETCLPGADPPPARIQVARSTALRARP